MNGPAGSHHDFTNLMIDPRELLLDYTVTSLNATLKYIPNEHRVIFTVSLLMTDRLVEKYGVPFYYAVAMASEWYWMMVNNTPVE